MTRDTCVVDYFFVCGLEAVPSISFTENAQEICRRLHQCYSASVLFHYPEARAHVPFDPDAVRTLALPHGLQFIGDARDIPAKFHSFLITRQDGTKLYGFSYIFLENLEFDVFDPDTERQPCDESQSRCTQSSVDQESAGCLPVRTASTQTRGRNIRVCKCIGVLMTRPHLDLASQFLSRIYCHVSRPCSALPFESHLCHLLHQLPVPAVGTCVRVGVVGAAECLLQLPSSAELPLLEFALSQLISLLGVEPLLLLLSSVLLEHQIVFTSLDSARLMLAGECMCALLFPFFWPHVYAPVLPGGMGYFLDAPVPYIMGVTCGFSAEQRSRMGNVCTVDLDRGEIEVPEDLPLFPCFDELATELTEQLASCTASSQKLSNIREEAPGCASLSESQTDTANCADRLSTSPGWSNSVSAQSKLSPTDQTDGILRISRLVRNAGLDLERLAEKAAARRLSGVERYINDQRYNNTAREVVLNRFVCIFLSYENFIVQPHQDMESWISSGSSSFDKVSFLSDLPRDHLPFLSRFIETQMFSAFIERKIATDAGDRDPAIALFDSRIKRVKLLAERTVRSPAYERCSVLHDTERVLVRRLQSPLLEASLPLQLSTSGERQKAAEMVRRSTERPLVIFPLPDPVLLAALASQVKREVLTITRQSSLQQHFQQERCISDARRQQLILVRSDSQDSTLVQNHSKFVEHVLMECKARTKRLLVERMGVEAAALGHVSRSAGLVGVEESTLVASLCDLLERIWAHGRQTSKGKSALWSHLRCYVQRQRVYSSDVVSSAPSTENHGASYGGSSPRTGTDAAPAGFQRLGRPAQRHSADTCAGDSELCHVFAPLPVSLSTDFRNVESIESIRTDIGYARAWVRLCLEKKLLACHLRQLLSDEQLLSELYKPYAFLCCEEEREQFLCHILSLNAVDYRAFSTNYPDSVVLYRVVILTANKPSASFTSANVWMRLSGSLAETAVIKLPPRACHVTFSHRNLGVLSTVRLGHDNSGASPNWLVRHLLVRNEVTGALWRLPCGRWLGRSVDDGGSERVLVAEQVLSAEEGLSGARWPGPRSGSADAALARRRSPSLSRRACIDDAHELRQTLTDAINSIVKYFHRSKKDRGPLAPLLCGERGLIPSLKQIFLFGFRSSRLFGKNLYLWDYLARVQQQYQMELSELSESCSTTSPEHAQSRLVLCCLISEIASSNPAMGKDDRFQAWLLISIRERLLAEFLADLSLSVVTPQMYEPLSFLRSAELLHMLFQLMSQLHEYDVRPERSLLCGVKTSHTPQKPPPSHSS